MKQSGVNRVSRTRARIASVRRSRRGRRVNESEARVVTAIGESCHGRTPNCQFPTTNHSQLPTPKLSVVGSWQSGMVGSWQLVVGYSTALLQRRPSVPVAHMQRNGIDERRDRRDDGYDGDLET